MVVGAGKRQYRNIVRVNQAIAAGQFKTNEVLQQVLNEVKEGNNTLHLIGSITDSMEETYLSFSRINYSDMKHLYALLECAKEAGIEHTYIHGILDGEDIPTGRYIAKYINLFIEVLNLLVILKIGLKRTSMAK